MKVICSEPLNKRTIKKRCVVVKQGYILGSHDPCNNKNLLKRNKRTKGAEPSAIRLTVFSIEARFTFFESLSYNAGLSLTSGTFSNLKRGPPVF